MSIFPTYKHLLVVEEYKRGKVLHPAKIVREEF